MGNGAKLVVKVGESHTQSHSHNRNNGRGLSSSCLWRQVICQAFFLVGEIVKHEAEFPRTCGISFPGLVKRSELSPASSSFNKAECPGTAQGPIERQGGFYFTTFQTYICKSKAHCILWVKRADQKMPRERIYRHPGFETKQSKSNHIHGGIHLGKHPAACAPKSSQGSL